MDIKNQETAYIGLGGNVGDVLANMASALRFLDADAETSLQEVSQVYKTPPWGIEDQDWFLNACAAVKTTRTAQELLELCLEAEIALKRERIVRWGPRTIDLDVLAYGNQEINEENLVIPHPRMQERLFVMQPLSDIAPELLVQNKPVMEWVRTFEVETLETVPLDPDWFRT